MTDVIDQRGEDKGREARNHGVFISNREIYDAIAREREERAAQGDKLGERIRSVEIKILGLLVPASLVALYIIKELWFK